MRIPLLTSDRTRNNELMIVCNSKVQYVPFPVPPVVRLPADTPSSHRSNNIEHLIDLETGKPIDVMRFDFGTTTEAMEFNKLCSEIDPRAESLRYVEQVYIEQEDFFLGYPNTDKLKLMAIDIEVMTYGTGIFPRATSNPIIAIGYKFGDEDPVAITDYDKKLTDFHILDQLLKAIEEKNPDIIIGYNSRDFDLPYILERMKIHNKKKGKARPHKLSAFSFSRTGEDIRTNKPGVLRWDVGGRIHYDAMDSVFRDQKLYGLKNRKLKTIAKHFGVQAETLDEIAEEGNLSDTHKLVNTPELAQYVASDANAAMEVGKIYLRNIVTLAELNKVPLGSVIDTYNSFIAKVTHAREFRRLKIFSGTSNAERYKGTLNIEDEESLEYEGAIVKINGKCPECGERVLLHRCKCGATYEKDEDLLPPGLVPEVHKIDFKCLSEDTELLVQDGWKRISEVEQGEICANFDSNTSRIEWHPVRQTFRYPSPGTMIHIQNRLTDQLLTENHRVIYTRGRKPTPPGDKKRYKNYHFPGEYRIREAKDLPTYIKIPVAGYGGEVARGEWADKFIWEENSLLWGYLLGIIISEGYRHGSQVCISQTDRNPAVVRRIDAVLLGLDIGYHRSSRERRRDNVRFTEHAWRISKEYSERILTLFDDANDVHALPSWILGSPEEFRGEVFNGLMDGDGHWDSEHTGTYATKRSDLADSFQALCVLSGWRSSISHSNNMYYIHIHFDRFAHVGLNGQIPTKDHLYQRVPYTKDVYCIETETGFMVCRRNGKCFITGNSMYPSTIMSANLSPETTKIVEFRPYKNEYRFVRKGDTLWMSIPDKNYNKSIIIRVDMSKQGFLPAGLKRLAEERIKLKKEQAERKSKGLEPSQQLDSQQHAIKVMLNIAYGYNGLKYCRYGDLAVAIATVGLSRWMTLNVEEWLGDCVVEIDTDGLYIDRWEDKWDERLNRSLGALIKRVLGTDSYMQLEYETAGTGYFYRSKNYIIREHDGSLVFHGVSFKSSRLSNVYERALHIMARAILEGEPDIWVRIEESMDKSSLTIRDFTMRTRLSKNPEDYASENGLAVKLAKQCQEVEGYSPKAGDQLEYVVTPGKEYKLISQVKSVEDVDRDYYNREVDKVLHLFDLEPPKTFELLEMDHENLWTEEEVDDSREEI